MDHVMDFSLEEARYQAWASGPQAGTPEFWLALAESQVQAQKWLLPLDGHDWAEADKARYESAVRAEAVYRENAAQCAANPG